VRRRGLVELRHERRAGESLALRHDDDRAVLRRDAAAALGERRRRRSLLRGEPRARYARMPDPSAARSPFRWNRESPWRWTSAEPRHGGRHAHRQPTCCSQRSTFSPGERDERHLRREPGRLLARRHEPTIASPGTRSTFRSARAFTLNRVAPPTITSGSSATFIVNTPELVRGDGDRIPRPRRSRSRPVPLRASPSAR
jgi:hypothetical protein